jgi:cytochrome oxidase Cu insertion factor (SCO1/SenC/PrrC family)
MEADVTERGEQHGASDGPGAPDVSPKDPEQRGSARRSRARTIVVSLGAVLAIATAMLAARHMQNASGQRVTTASGPPSVEAGGGFPIRGRTAPGFRLTDQFGRAVSLSSLRGREVVLAFIDSRCETVCPLTAAILRNALGRISPADAGRVDLVAVNANPIATRVADVYRFSEETGMLHEWKYLTGSPAQLKAVYGAYQVYVCVKPDGAVVHTAAIYLIDPRGYERLYFQALNSNAGITVGSETRAIVTGMRQWLPGVGV